LLNMQKRGVYMPSFLKIFMVLVFCVATIQAPKLYASQQTSGMVPTHHVVNELTGEQLRAEIKTHLQPSEFRSELTNYGVTAEEAEQQLWLCR
jgi:hypothetical protein